MKHLLSIEALTAADLRAILDLAAKLKAERGRHTHQPLKGQVWAMLFSKSSTRTRVSFEVGVRELGGDIMFLSSADIQLGRGEPIRDTARVLGRMIHGAIIRTFDQKDVEDFATYGAIPTINALTDEEHPCQVIADLLTIKEKIGTYEDFILSFLGDGDCNMARSWLWAAEKLGFQLKIGAPQGFQPTPALLSRMKNPHTIVTEDPVEAVLAADILYTDVWISMGKEAESADRLAALAPYQVNAALLRQAAPGAHVMHCLPAYREKEITTDILEAHAQTIFDQAENRLHAQKAIITWMLS